LSSSDVPSNATKHNGSAAGCQRIVGAEGESNANEGTLRTGGGRGGIRTLEAVLPPTRFPVARTRPGYATLPKRLLAIGHRLWPTSDSSHRLHSGGEGGIRTHGGSSPHRFSRAAPSTTRTPLQAVKYTNALQWDGTRIEAGRDDQPVARAGNDLLSGAALTDGRRWRSCPRCGTSAAAIAAATPSATLTIKASW
jgi:hypothetical protein